MTPILLEKISGTVSNESAEQYLDRLYELSMPFPVLKLGRVSIVSSLDKIAHSGTFTPREIKPLQSHFRMRLRGKLVLHADTNELCSDDAEMTLEAQRRKNTETYYLLLGKPTLYIVSL